MGSKSSANSTIIKSTAAICEAMKEHKDDLTNYKSEYLKEVIVTRGYMSEVIKRYLACVYWMYSRIHSFMRPVRQREEVVGIVSCSKPASVWQFRPFAKLSPNRPGRRESERINHRE